MVFRPSLLMGKLPKPPAISDDRKHLTGTVYIPTSPLELGQQSPKTWRRRDGEGIGLGIVASLEKTCVKTTNNHIVVPAVVRTRPLNLCQQYQKPEVGFKYDMKLGLGRESSFPTSSMTIEVGENFRDFQVADFLSNCCLCSKNLHGKDIYMYRGDKAFCSEECRYKQMISDEYQEKIGVEDFKSPEISSSPVSDRLFFTGIIVS